MTEDWTIESIEKTTSALVGTLRKHFFSYIADGTKISSTEERSGGVNSWYYIQTYILTNTETLIFSI